MYRVSLNLFGQKSDNNRALNLIVRRSSISKTTLRLLFEKHTKLNALFDAEQLISLLGHINLDRAMRARNVNMAAIDVSRILWVDILEKLPDTGYEPLKTELDLRFHYRSNAKPIGADLAEFRKLAS